jgi:hypothetical protein
MTIGMTLHLRVSNTECQTILTDCMRNVMGNTNLIAIMR